MGKPVSGKQKKQWLQAKRQQDREKQAADGAEEDKLSDKRLSNAGAFQRETNIVVVRYR